MIQADLNGKTGVPEDVLTSCCLGLLQLLPDNYFIEMLKLARTVEKRYIDLSDLDTVKQLYYWPWLNDGGIPDIIITLESRATSRRVNIVIEVKHGSGKSGGEEDQLARYYKAAVKNMKDHEIFLIYLTHHRIMPVDDLNVSISLLTDPTKVTWLSWYTVAKWALMKMNHSELTEAEWRILSTLKRYLYSKGYLCFEQLFEIELFDLDTLYNRYYLPIHAGLPITLKKIYRPLYCNQDIRSVTGTIYMPQG
jgi:hypothetical protein